MSEENKQVALNSDHGVNLNMGFMVANTLQDAIKISEIIANSGVCPTAYKGKPGDVLVAMQMGAEVGLKPMQALQNIAVINGKPSIYGDAMLAICRQSKQFEYITERYIPEKNGYICIVKRRNEPEFQQTFDEKDARQAGLWGKQGPWTLYSKRMLQMRARGFALRDAFPDLLRGIITGEEAEDLPPEEEKAVDYSRAVGAIVEGEKIAQTVALINSEQLEILQTKISMSDSKLEDICKYADIEKLEDMPASQWANTVKLLDKKIKKNAQTKAMQELAQNKSAPDIDQFYAELGDVDKETGEVV